MSTQIVQDRKDPSITYELGRLLGRGTDGWVRFATRIQGIDRRDVAIKIGHKAAENYNEYKMFRRLAKDLDRLNDSRAKYFVRPITWLMFNESCAYVMDYMPNTLSTIPSLTLPQIRTYLRQIIQALTVLHERNLVHGDVKPENVLVDPQSAVALLADGGHIALGNQIGIIQTIFYRAPEVLLGLPYSAKADMWSIGCIIYSMLQRKEILFDDYSEKGMLELIIKALGPPPPSPFRLPRNLPQETHQQDYLLRRFQATLGRHDPSEHAQLTDLALKMLTYAKPRISAPQALQHPFLATSDLTH